MRRICAVAALLLSVAPTLAADPMPAEEAPSKPWYNRIFGGSSEPPKPAPTTIAPGEKAPTRQDLSRSLEQEQKVYMERLQFCTKLRQIAVETNDDELLRKAEDLEKQAEQVFMQRTNKLPSILEDVKAAEANLDRKKDGAPTGSAAKKTDEPKPIVRRAPNGRPIRE